MTKYSNKYFSESEKLNMDEKINLLKKDYIEFSINNFFPKRNEVRTIYFG